MSDFNIPVPDLVNKSETERARLIENWMREVNRQIRFCLEKIEKELKKNG